MQENAESAPRRGTTYRRRRRVLARPGRNFVIALLLSYAAFFSYGVYFADASSGGPEVEGQLVLTACEPNWALLGARSQCEGTITVGPGELKAGQSIPYSAAFSWFESADVGRPIPVHNASVAEADGGWEALDEQETPVLAELFIGPLAIAALAGWYITLAGIISLGIARVRRNSSD